MLKSHAENWIHSQNSMHGHLGIKNIHPENHAKFMGFHAKSLLFWNLVCKRKVAILWKIHLHNAKITYLVGPWQCS